MYSSMLFNFIRSIKNSQKKFNLEEFHQLEKVECSAQVTFSSNKLVRYMELIEWKSEEIPPLFPYALITHLQFSIVNDKKFPFPPFGLIHKTEKIHCLKPLAHGTWLAKMSVDSYRILETGVEIDFKTELWINNELSWISITTAFKKLKTKIRKNEKRDEITSSHIFWTIPNGFGAKYGLVSLNIDPIHMFNLTAKMMGHKSAIIHGMWTVARGLSEFNKFDYPLNINARFISPIYLPAKVMFERRSDGFSVYSEDGKKTHVTVDLK
jgi:hypothetical protein